MKPILHFKKRDIYLIFIIFLSVIMASACTIPGLTSPTGDNSQQSMESTITALNLQATSFAQQSTQDAQNVQATVLAQQQNMLATQQALITQQAGELSGTEGEEIPAVVLEEPGSATPLSNAEPVETEALPEATEELQIIDAELESKIQAAKILLFEDISGSRTRLPRYVKEALDYAGYSYTDVGSAQGWLKDQLMSNTEWDLIIISSEESGRISGEFFDYLTNYAEKGTAIILEFWDLDAIFQGRSKALLDKCGIEFEADWTGGPSSSLRFLQPDHPIFNIPNELSGSLNYYKRVWIDGGDLVQIKRYGGKVMGDATLLIGTQQDQKDSHGVLSSCMGGRVLIQTFTTHQYDSEDMLNLWENYIQYTLKNHFLYKP